MTRYASIWICALTFLFGNNLFSQDSSVRFSFTNERLNDQEVLLKIKAHISPGIELFGIQRSPDDPLYSNVHFDSSASHLLKDSLATQGMEREAYDSLVGAPVHYFYDSAAWHQKVKAATQDSFLLKGTLSYMYKKGEQYLPAEEDFKFFIQPGIKPSQAISTGESNIASQSLWWIFITAFAGGLLALLTPCVYSMIPVTVSFFTKRSKNRVEGIRNALYYSTSIVVIFTLLGFLITVIFGPAALNNLATNWVANLLFFALF
ncbi:MAG: cytochrome c biogenesis protein CcdA, partial [Ginsengibacter sp.]